MQEKLNIKLTELEHIIKNSSTYKETKDLREKLLKKVDLLNEINNLKNNENIYSNSYKDKKKKLYEDEDYKRYQQLENELYLLTLEINKKLNTLTKKGSCNHENN